MKLSTAQRKILLAMKNGRELHFMRSFGSHAFLGGKGAETVRLPTFRILRDGGYIRLLAESNYGQQIYKISDKGKNAIKAKK